MISMLMLTGVVGGLLITRTGRYKWMPLAGSFVVVLALALMSTMNAATPAAMSSVYAGILGLGIGLGMQVLMLIVQNSLPVAVLGAATAASQFFREVGGLLGSALVGNLFVNRLSQLLGPAANARLSAAQLTPSAISSLSPAVRAQVVQSYANALTPVFLLLIPLMLVAAAALAFVKEVPLATTAPELDVQPVGRSAVE
jgi:MFS family permease